MRWIWIIFGVMLIFSAQDKSSASPVSSFSENSCDFFDSDYVPIAYFKNRSYLSIFKEKLREKPDTGANRTPSESKKEISLAAYFLASGDFNNLMKVLKFLEITLDIENFQHSQSRGRSKSTLSNNVEIYNNAQQLYLLANTYVGLLDINANDANTLYVLSNFIHIENKFSHLKENAKITSDSRKNQKHSSSEVLWMRLSERFLLLRSRLQSITIRKPNYIERVEIWQSRSMRFDAIINKFNEGLLNYEDISLYHGAPKNSEILLSFIRNKISNISIKSDNIEYILKIQKKIKSLYDLINAKKCKNLIDAKILYEYAKITLLIAKHYDEKRRYFHYASFDTTSIKNYKKLEPHELEREVLQAREKEGFYNQLFFSQAAVLETLLTELFTTRTIELDPVGWASTVRLALRYEEFWVWRGGSYAHQIKRVFISDKTKFISSLFLTEDGLGH